MVKQEIPCSVHLQAPDLVKLATGILRGTHLEILVFPGTRSDGQAYSSLHLMLGLPDASVAATRTMSMSFDSRH